MKIDNIALNFSTNKAFYASFAFFLLSFLLLFSLLKKVIPLTVSHAVYYCQTLLANTIIALPHSLPSLFVILLLLIFSTGVFIFTIQVIKMRVLITRLSKNRIPMPRKVVAISQSLGIASRVDVVKDRRCLSFCCGFQRTRIILSSQLLKILTEGELKAVLIHEQYHLKNYDPLKIMLGQIATSMFWFLPVIKDFHDHFVVLKEFSADQWVLDVQKSAKNLKLALAKVVDYPITPTSGIVPFTTIKGLEARILHLTGKREKPSFKLSAMKLFMSSFMILFIFVTINIPIYAIETSTNTHSYLICPTNSSCTGTSVCSREQMIKENFMGVQPMSIPLKYSSK